MGDGGGSGAGPSRRPGSPGGRSRTPWPPPLAWLLLLVVAAATATWAQDRKLLPPVGLKTLAGTLAPHPGCLGQCHVAHVPARRNAHKNGAEGLDPVCLACHQGPKVAADLGAAKLPAATGALSIHILDPNKRKQVHYSRQIKNGKATLTLRYDCSGCHDVHGREPGPMLAPQAFDPQGQPLAGKPVYAADVCFGCHAGLGAAPIGGRVVDIGKLFGRGGGSAHAVGHAAADRPDLPSLRSGRNRAKLDCVSCHGNSNPAGVPGPHVSQFPRLLKADYASETEAFGSALRAGELCYLCHDRSSIEADQSFSLHMEHITGFTRGASGGAPRTSVTTPAKLGAASLKGTRPAASLGLQAGYGQPTPCATCHDPHGSPTNPYLLAFDPGVVTPSAVGGIAYRSLGLGHGTCTLTCHGHSHAQAQY